MERSEEDPNKSKRQFRNLLEKKRRDEYNSIIKELRSMVSLGSNSSKGMDKSAVLEATTAYIKAHSEPVEPPKTESETRTDWKPSILSDEEFSYLLLEALDGFIIVISDTGKILYVSESVTSLLGHLPMELVNSSVYEYINPAERNNLAQILSYYPENNAKFEYSLNLNMRLGNFETLDQEEKFQLVKLHGHYKRFNPTSDTAATGGESEFGFIFVCIGRLLESDLVRDMSTVVVDSTNMEFKFKMSMEWKYIYVDDRAPPIIGYTPFELLGTSGYDLVHTEDLDKLAASHERLMAVGHGNSCLYRFLTKGQQWIWLQSRYEFTINRNTSKREAVDCIQRVVSYADVKAHLKSRTGSSSSKTRSQPTKKATTEGGLKTSAALPTFTATRPGPSTVNTIAPMPIHSQEFTTSFDPRIVMQPYMKPQNTTASNRWAPSPVTAFYMNPVTTPSGETFVGYSSGILLTPDFREELRLADAGQFGSRQGFSFGPPTETPSYTPTIGSGEGPALTSASGRVNHPYQLNFNNQTQHGTQVDPTQSQTSPICYPPHR